MSTSALEIASALARRFEGLYLTPYLCPAGVPTIGYGSTHYEDGSRVQLTDQAITKDRAEELLMWELKRQVLPQVMVLCPGIDSEKRLAALMDFAFNLGSGRLRSSTLRRKANAGEWDDVPGELRKWIYGGGKRLRGLVLRRDAEAALVP